MFRLAHPQSLLSAIFALLFIGAAVCQQSPPTYNAHSCLDSNESKPTYRSGLSSLLNSLSAESSSSTYYKDTISGIQGFFLCRGDVSSQECETCVQAATQSLPNRCPVNKGAIIWYDQCMLRYSNNSFFGTVQPFPRLMMWNIGNESSRDRPNFGSSGFVNELTDLSDSTEMLFSTIERDGRYGLAQCSRDLGRNECANCLEQLAEEARSCCQNKAGWRVLTTSCFLRFEEYRFFELPSSPAPQPGTTGGGGKGRKTVAIVVALVAAAVALIILGVCCYLFCFRKKRQQGEGTSEVILLGNRPPWMEGEGVMDGIDEDENGEMKHFSLAAIRTATSNFSSSNKLGEGGFGPVYKGTLPGGIEVAVKRLSLKSKQGVEEFRNEVKLIIKLQHKNLVRLLGYCLEGDEKLLVYEYMANTSLDSYLFDPTKCKVLDWTKRANIVKGTARGLQYLHEDSRLKIIHRDMKASNVLLDDEMNPKISDFGTARIFGGNQIEANTERVVGTYGYMAPEYALEGLFSVKSDVYGYGVLMLEIISGKKNRGSYHLDAGQSLLTYVWMLWNEDKGLELIDPNIVDDCALHEVLRWIHIALLCVQDDPTLRPTMSSVVLMLESKSVNLPVPATPPYSAAKFLTMFDQTSMSGTRSDFLASDLSTTGAST